MRYGYPLAFGSLLATAVLLASCGGNNTGDVFPSTTPADAAVTGPNSFLLFPNPQVQDDGTVQTDTEAYATAYYAAIDPNNDKDTLAKWKAANGFGNSSTGTEVSVTVGDIRDLGYGRYITARKNNDGTVAVMVENYLVSPAANYSYSSLNLDAAVARDQRWHVGTNGIEFSGTTCVTGTSGPDPAGCDPTVPFAKFYTFDATTGQRKLMAELDGRGVKAMPGICISCHGGRGDPLTPATGSPTGVALFPLVAYAASQKRGDVQAHLQPLKVDSFDYSTVSGFSRAAQEAALKTINTWVLGTYPIAAPTVYPEDAPRRTAVIGEWDSTAATAMIKDAYGGDGLPNANYSDTYVPSNWASLGQTTLYQSVIVPSCRTCHILRGTNAMDDLNFDNFCTESAPGVCDATVNDSKFYGYASQIKHHVIDKGNMPLAKIVYQDFWSGGEPDIMATFLGSAQPQAVRDTGGAVLRPGRPVAVPGPDRTTTSPVQLSAQESLYATSYQWTVLPGSSGTLDDPTSPTPTLTDATDEANVLQLVVSNGTVQSDPVTVTMTIDSTMGTGGSFTATPVFADIKAVLQGTVAGCSGCHTAGGGQPILYTNIDRNNDGFVDATDDYWFYTELRGRINFTDVADSPLLRKPTGHHHGGGDVLNFADSTACGTCGPYATKGAYYAAAYNMFVNWILNGAPYN